MPIISALRRLRQKNLKLKASLGYRETLSERKKEEGRKEEGRKEERGRAGGKEEEEKMKNREEKKKKSYPQQNVTLFGNRVVGYVVS
jgi:hypothetical protein